MFKTQFAMLTTVVVAVAASACSAPEARPAAAASATTQCAGSTVHNAAEAARYAGCETVVGDLRITGSDLRDVSVFQNVRSISGKLEISNNQKLISLAGLKGVERARSVEIRNNPVLAGYFGLLPELEQVDAPLVLESNRGLSKREVAEVLERIEVRAEQVTANVDASGSERVN